MLRGSRGDTSGETDTAWWSRPDTMQISKVPADKVRVRQEGDCPLSLCSGMFPPCPRNVSATEGTSMRSTASLSRCAPILLARCLPFRGLFRRFKLSIPPGVIEAPLCRHTLAPGTDGRKRPVLVKLGTIRLDRTSHPLALCLTVKPLTVSPLQRYLAPPLHRWQTSRIRAWHRNGHHVVQVRQRVC